MPGRILLCLLLSCGFHLLLGQGLYLDSVMQVIHQEKLDGPAQIKRLNVISSELIESGDYENARTCAIALLELSTKLKNKEGEFLAYLNLGNLESDNGNNQSALSHFNQCLTIADGLHNSRQIASAHHSIGSVYYNQGDYQEAMTHFTISLELRQKLDLKNDLIDSYTNIGNIHTLQGEYTDATRNYLQVLRLSEELNNSVGIINAHNNMGVVAWNQGNLEEAMHHFEESSAKAKEIHDLRSLSNSTNNIGNLYFVQEKYAEAAPYYIQALEIRKQINDKYGMAVSYNNVGVICEHQGRLEEALQNYEAAKQIQQELNDQRGLTASYLNIGSINSRLGNYQLAIDTTQKGIDLARLLGIRDHVKEGYGILYDIYKNMKDYEKAIAALEQYNTMKDSLLNLETEQSVADLKIQYETEKKEKENLVLTHDRDRQKSLNELLKKENLIAGLNFQNESNLRQLAESQNNRQQDSLINLREKQTIQDQLMHQEHEMRSQEQELHKKELYARNLGLWLLGILLSFGSLVIYLINRVRQRRMDARFKETEEKALRAQLKPHFVFNALAAIQNLVKQKPEIAEHYLSKFSHFTQEVLVNSEKKRISLTDELNMLTNYIELQSLRLDQPITYEYRLGPNMDTDDILVPPAIFQPLIENSVNHNFALKGGVGKIILDFNDKNGVLLCRLEDSCPGTIKSLLVNQEKVPQRKSFGRKIVEERLELWSKGKLKKGFLEFNPQPNGMLVTIGIPL